MSVAWCILRNGFTVGNGQHRKNGTTRHGIFGISNGGLFERLLLARDRSTTNRDTEWRFGISGWSTPCVIAFAAACVVAKLGRIGECRKCCIEAPVGSSMQLPTDAMFCLMKPEYMRYRLLPSLHEPYMICGGKEHLGVVDPVYWASGDNNMRPSCGRTCSLRSLRSGNTDWVKSKAGHIWFCSLACRDQLTHRWT